MIAWIGYRLLVLSARRVHLSETKFLPAVNFLARLPVFWNAVGGPRAPVDLTGGCRASGQRLDGFGMFVNGGRLVEREDACATDDTT